MRTIKLLIITIIAFTFNANGQEISPWLFGQNHWMDKSDEGKRPGYVYMLWPKVEASGIKMVRIGGIGYENHFPDQKTLTSMLDSIRLIGAEPILQVPRTFTDEQVTDLITYLNKNPNRVPVHFWSIGNEPICNNKGKIDDVYKFLIRLAPVMKAADPTIKIFVFDECSFLKEAYEALCGGRLDITGKDKNGHWIIDGFTFHNYPNGRAFSRDNVVFSGPFGIRNQARQLTEMMEKADRKNGRTGQAKLLWGLTETNVTYVNPDREIAGFGNPSFLGGQFIAEIYGIGMEYGAFTVDPWCISETDRISSDFGYLGLPSEFYPRSSYYHTQMMALNMKGKFLASESNNSFVKSISSMSDTEICVMVLNKDQMHDFKFDIILNKNGESSKPLSVNVDAGLDRIVSGSITNQTTMLFVFSKTGDLKRQYTYGLTQNLKNQPPDVLEFRTPEAFIQNKRLGRGVNILGYDPIWQSRDIGRFKEDHFRIIKEGGFSSVRVNLYPFRYMDQKNNYKLPQSWFDLLDWVLEKALDNKLMVILDFHEFTAMAENPVTKKEIFLSFWRQVAPRYKNMPSNVLFEIMNEPNGQLTPAMWNGFLAEALAIIRESNPTRTVVIGPGFWNQIPHLDELKLPDNDRNIIVTIHYYSPHNFTHQGAPWSKGSDAFLGTTWGTDQDKAAVRADFQKAKDWSAAHKRPILLGEFGAYERADMDSRVRYTSYVARTAEEFGFSWNYWQFDSDFIVYNIDKGMWNEPIYRALITAGNK